MVFVCGGSAAASIVALALLSRDKIGAQKKNGARIDKKNAVSSNTKISEEETSVEAKEDIEQQDVTTIVQNKDTNHSNGMIRNT